MEFAVPLDQIWVPQVTPFVTPVSNGVFLEGASGDEDDHELEVVELVPSSGEYPMEDLLFGERIHSVRAMMQKPSRIFWTDSTGYYSPTANLSWPTRPANMLVPQFGPFPTVDWVSTEFVRFFDNSFTYFGYYRALYLGIACSERYKYIARGESEFFGACPFYFSGIPGASTNDASTIPGMLSPMSCVGPNRGYEVVVPYYDRKKFELGFTTKFLRDDNTDSPNQKFTQLFLCQTASTVLGAATPGPMYHSAGPDIRCVGFRQVPTVAFENVTVTNTLNQFLMRAGP
jgi:hypothetical protein